MLSVLLLAGGLAAPAAQPRFELQPCDTPGLPGQARCGTYRVWEDRARQVGRQIGLKVVVVPARGRDRRPDPFVFIRCRTELEKKADLTLYTTPIAMDDLEEVRAALGYPAINIFAGSYGTRAALVYVRRHPEGVRTATLQGVAPPSYPMPLAFARDAQRALDGVLAECAAEAGCGKAFPDLPAEVKAVFAALERAPVRAEILDPQSGDPAAVSISRDLVAEAIRYLLYQSSGASLIPVLVHQASRGDFGPLAEFVESGSARDADPACAAGIKRPSFPTSLPPLKPVAVAESDLAAVAGRYAAEGGAFEATVQAAAGKIKVILPGGRTSLLVPVSPTRFRLVGALSTFAVFEMEAGRAQRLTLEEGGVGGLSLKRAN